MKWILILLSSLASIAVLEIGVRVMSPLRTLEAARQERLNCYQESPDLPYEYIPGCTGSLFINGSKQDIHLNSVGLREREIEEKRRKRILLLGDSFVFGYGVLEEERFGRLLEPIVRSEVVSVGFGGGAGPDMLYRYLVSRGVLFQPDGVILALFPYNDLSDIESDMWGEEGDHIVSVKSKFIRVDDGYLSGPYPHWKYRVPLLRHSQLFQFLVPRFESLTYRAKLAARKLGIVVPGRDEKHRMCLYFGRCVGSWATAVENGKRILRMYKEATESRQIPFRVIVIPAADQVFGSDPVETVWHRLLREEDISFYDLSGNLKESGYSQNELYLPDGHWTPLGHKIAAEVLAAFIQSSEVVPR